MADIIDIMKKKLKPRGSLPLVVLHLKPCATFSTNFVAQCIEELQHSIASNGLKPLTNLEKLAVHVLMDSAGGIDI